MNNHIYRHGLMAKKTGDGRREIIFHKEKPGPRPPQNYNRTLIARDLQQLGCCGFNHEPYSLDLELADDSGKDDGAFLADYLYDHVEQFTDEQFDEWLARPQTQEYLEGDHPVDLYKIVLGMGRNRSDGSLQLRLALEPRQNSTYAPMRELMILDFHTLEGQPSQWSILAPASQVSVDALSETNIPKLSGWIDDCVANHGPCAAVTRKLLPARLLHVKRSLDEKELLVRLHVVDSKQTYKFVALSHCWANSKPIKTTSSNIKERLQGIAWIELPRVFRDTVRLCIQLGIHYIWIDSLCIMQGDEADWLEESPKMGAIYGSAHVVFAAHGPSLALTKDIRNCTREGTETSHTLLGDPKIFARSHIDHSCLVNPSDDTDTYFGRAWCFQERHFASRILHFGGDWEEIFFECNVAVHCECNGIEKLQLREKNEASSAWEHQKSSFSATLEKIKTLDASEAEEQLWRMYTSLCETFSSQGLSNPDDTLLALSSLADRIGPYLGDYYAGLCKYNLIIALQWESLDGRQSNRHNSYVAPTFLWTSRTGPVVWYVSNEYLQPNVEKCEYAEVMDIQCDTSPGAPFGRVKGGFVKLRGYTIQMQFEDAEGCYSLGRLGICSSRDLLQETESNAGESGLEIAVSSQFAEVIEEPSKSKRKRTGRRVMTMLGLKKSIPKEATATITTNDKNEDETSFVCMDSVDDMLHARGKTVTCIDLMRDREGPYCTALILRSVDETPGAFRRVGISTMSKDLFSGARLEVVTIM